jgi:4-hydroxy-2-oxoheptanedioate aldolase
MITIETAEAVRNIDEICKVEGVDCIVIGSFDLTTDLGISGQFGHPMFGDACARIEKAALQAGVPLGGAAFTPEQSKILRERGYRILLHGFDVLMLGHLVREAKHWQKF